MSLGPRPFLIAAAIVGFGWWLSRAVLDVTGTGAGVRVAYFPSWPELAGFVVLAGLLLTLAQAAAERLLSGRRSDASRSERIPAEVLAPVGLLLLLALPYLPGLPDAVPALTAAAGPLRWWIWTLALGLCGWSLISHFRTQREERAAPSWREPAIVALVLGLILGVAMNRLSPGPIFPGGDEPHYLVVTQSLVRDGNLRIDENHARGDYREFFERNLKPDHIVAPARDGAIYSIHPIGVSLLVAPGFAAAGYRGATLTIVAIALAAALVLWSWLRAITQSAGAAMAGTLAVVTSAPFVLHGFAIYPEIPAALAILLALGWQYGTPDSLRSAAWRGVAVALLPWLGTKYAPMSAVILLLLALRTTRDTRRWLALVVPYGISLVLWAAWFEVLWGNPFPTAPYGTAHQMALSNLAAGLPGLLFDQEYGVVAVAPILALVPIGWWRLWNAGDAGRRLVLETALPLLTLAVTVGAYAMWWGGSAPPGRQLVAALPLTAVPVAWLWRELAGSPVRRAALVMLLLIGLALTGTLVLARDGMLIANGRDGAAELLDYLAPRRDVGRLLPSFTVNREALGLPLGLVLLWSGCAAGAWWLAGRVRTLGHGMATTIGAAVVMLAPVTMAVVVPRLFASMLPPQVPAEERAQAAALDGFDAIARPLAVVFSPWTPAQPQSVPPRVIFEATPGSRRARQPLPVLLNTRLALPAGQYQVTLSPHAGSRLTGVMSLQLGRIGPPRETWTVAAGDGEAWRQTFALDIDTNFVGFRADRALESSVGSLEVRAVTVIDAGRRVARPPVLAAALYGAVPVYFHDANADLEPKGFWARGGVPLMLSVGVPADASPRGVRLQLHSGARPNTVTIATTAWSSRITLLPGEPKQILVPALERQRLLPLTITPESGFVPAEHGGDPGDRRRLGCWVEVLP